MHELPLNALLPERRSSGVEGTVFLEHGTLNRFSVIHIRLHYSKCFDLMLVLKMNILHAVERLNTSSK